MAYCYISQFERGLQAITATLSFTFSILCKHEYFGSNMLLTFLNSFCSKALRQSFRLYSLPFFALQCSFLQNIHFSEEGWTRYTFN